MSCFWRRDYCSIQFNSRAVGWNDFCSPGQDHLYFTSSPQKLHERASARVSPFPGTTCACMTRLQMNGATQAVGANFSNYLRPPLSPPTHLPQCQLSQNPTTEKHRKAINCNGKRPKDCLNLYRNSMCKTEVDEPNNQRKA